MIKKKKIMFLCTANSCRSQMAEGFANKIGKDRIKVYSAGLMTAGVHRRAIAVMKEVGIDDSLIEKFQQISREKLPIPFIIGAMPIQDAIDLAAFLVGTTINFSKFSPGASTVGGPIDIAVITKHEGFKWIKRKYYYNRDINPENNF